jgi:hypothetical protein
MENSLFFSSLIISLSQHSDVAGVLDEPYSQLSPLSGENVQARLST